jgi:hypothetical protein
MFFKHFFRVLQIRELEAALRGNRPGDAIKVSSQGNSEDSSIFDQYIQPTQGVLEASQSFSQESESDIDDLAKSTPGMQECKICMASSKYGCFQVRAKGKVFEL